MRYQPLWSVRRDGGWRGARKGAKKFWISDHLVLRRPPLATKIEKKTDAVDTSVVAPYKQHPSTAMAFETKNGSDSAFAIGL